MDDEDEEAVILTPAILALVPVAADGANVSKSDAMSVFDDPVVFKEKNKSSNANDTTSAPQVGSSSKHRKYLNF